MSIVHGGDAQAGSSQAPSVSARALVSTGERNVQGLDTIRFWCALWVYFSHFGFLPIPEDGSIPPVVVGIYHNAFCGVAAVIAFFVISGFCIHIPFVGAPGIPLRSFYLRRYVRVLSPLAVALLAAAVCGADMVGFYQSILWSLIAESLYYAVYPWLRPLIMHKSRALLAGAYLLALGLIARDWSTLNFHSFGPATTWLVGMPSWLLGCRLATWAVDNPSRAMRAPWGWRAVVWGTSSLAAVLRFHAHIGYPISLTLFGALAFLWLREEIRYFRSVPPPAWSEFCGRFSYSIYLVHGLSARGFEQLATGLPPVLGWILQTAFVLLASYVFYLAVERPSHLLARRLARAWGAETMDPIATRRAA